MKDDDTLNEGTPISTDTHSLNRTNKEVVHPVSSVPAITSKKTSSGKGLYIAAIVLGVIIVILLALYIYLALTHKNTGSAFNILKTLPEISIFI